MDSTLAGCDTGRKGGEIDVSYRLFASTLGVLGLSPDTVTGFFPLLKIIHVCDDENEFSLL